MRKKKKIVQSLVAGILSLGLCASVVPMGASAVTYDRYDVNHDGEVDIRDVVYINQYLVGAFSVASPSALDINQNKVIDTADSFEILASRVGNSVSVEFVNITEGLNPVQTIPDELLAEFGEKELFPSEEIAELYATSNSNTYYKYNCTTKTLSTYTLSVSENTPASISDADELNSINAVSDDNYYRVNGNGMDGIVKVATSIHDIGTGFIVGDHVIATAAHCVWSRKGNGFCDDLKVQMCNANEFATSTKYTVKEIHIPKAYTDNPSQGTDGNPYDYALLTVSEDLSAYTHFELGVASTNDINNMSEVPLTISGFPDDAPNSEAYVYTSVGQEHGGKDSDEQHLYYTNKTAGGMSGAPVYTVTDVYQGVKLRERKYTVLAIHSSNFGYKFGSAMNSFTLAFYKVNPNIGY
ncbi:MAG: trypsin-like peptidase domain-containing protein [Oscillospiraceae bacterium]|nr:trypsin-like peptidase domain-containing protein [Oscillospiraceae bacterium]